MSVPVARTGIKMAANVLQGWRLTQDDLIWSPMSPTGLRDPGFSSMKAAPFGCRLEGARSARHIAPDTGAI